jgi:hypothetical protein
LALSRAPGEPPLAHGGANPGSQIITVTSTPHAGGLSTGVTYGAGQPTGWLVATLAATSTPTDLTLQAMTGTLVAGMYTATVAVSSP